MSIVSGESAVLSLGSSPAMRNRTAISGILKARLMTSPDTMRFVMVSSLYGVRI